MPARFARLRGLAFVMEKIGKYNLSQLGEIKIKEKPFDYGHTLCDVWGNHKHPTYKSAHTSKHRISIMVRCDDSMLPVKIQRRFPARYGRKYRPTAQYRTTEECIVWIVGHEMFHYLAKHGQVPGDYRDEVAACTMGEAWVEEFRLWKEVN